MDEHTQTVHPVSRPVGGTVAPSPPPPAPRFAFLRITGLLAGIACFVSSAFFGGWALVEIGRSVYNSSRWGGGGLEYYHIMGIISSVIGMGLGTALGLAALSLSRTLATAAGDSRRTAEMIERML